MKDNIEKLFTRINKAALQCGRRPESVKMIAVSKTVEAEYIKSAIDAGLQNFGENYIQEALKKIDSFIGFPVIWHFIGHLQSNKAKYAVRHFDMIHTVDSIKLAEALNHEAKKISKVQNILIQVNISLEATKSGIRIEEAVPLINEISKLGNLSVRGLMTMPPYSDSPEDSRPFFRELANLKQTIINLSIPNVFMDELSMGMSDDFEVAISEGATLIRIGTAIFGER